MVRMLFFIVLISLGSCQRGYINNYGIYNPKKPNYKLKNKQEFIFPKLLDTINIYVTTQKIDLLPNKYTLNYKLDYDHELDYEFYIKFFNNGTCITFGKFPTEQLQKKHLNPKNCLVCYYYYDTKKNEIKIETFGAGEGGYGTYITSKNYLNYNGSILKKTFERGDTTYYKKVLLKKLQ